MQMQEALVAPTIPADVMKHHEEEGRSNPVWEDVAPIVWRNAIYSEEARDNCMGQLFEQEVMLFKDIISSARTRTNLVGLIEPGQGTAELFSKVHRDVDYCVGVELNGGMIDLAHQLHPQLKYSPQNRVHLIEGNALDLVNTI